MAVVPGLGGDVDQALGRLDAGGDLGQAVALDLEGADGAAEGLALPRVGDGAGEQVLGGADALEAADQPFALQLPHDLLKALALLAQQGVGADGDVDQRQLGGV